MKKLLCILLCLTLIFSNVNLCFATWSDNQISSVVSDVSSIKTTLSNIYTRVTSISNSLIDSNHSVAYWASAIASWMQPIYQALTSNLVANLNLEPIVAGLNEVVSSGGNTSYTPYLKYGGKSNSNWLSDLYDLDKLNGFEGFRNGTYVDYYVINSDGSYTSGKQNLSAHNWRTNFMTYEMYLLQNMARIYQFTTQGMTANQTIANWFDLNSSYNFTPSSAVDGIYKYLNSIQNPVARLSYVLASEERIEAQEAAAANEEAVVDNFIDSNGDGSMSPSNIGSVSDLSAGYKQNFGTDASPSGIFDIFNADHASWFSQETKNQLDTTTSSRLTKGSQSETPLLDKQIEDIYNALGVKQP